MSYFISNQSLIPVNNNHFNVFSNIKTFDKNALILDNNNFSKLKFNFRNVIFYFRQMNKMLHKPLRGYYYVFFLAFKKQHVLVSNKSYSHQFFFFLNFKLKNSVCFYFIDKINTLFFEEDNEDYENEDKLVSFFVSSKNNKIDWTIFKYFWGQTKKYPSYYIELNYNYINKIEVNKVLFFFKFNTLKYCREKKLSLFNNYYNNVNKKRKFKFVTNNRYYKYIKKKNSFFNKKK